ncbi:MAG TPA: hypothetical protein RMH99_17515 [Sandaracinaceae bacterium LLY-WYZ-13_1]|nr:hypothetical protein [Sandaracinaceae bacterium LLY-WYZ-13_1]
MLLAFGPALAACGAGHRCVIDRGCPSQAAVPTCEAAPGDVVALGELAARGRTLAGQRVAVRGVLRAGSPSCTELECGPDRRCCNTCGAPLMLFPGPAERGSAAAPLATSWGCEGDDTELCCEHAPGPDPVIVVGTLRARGGLHLEAESACAP